MKYTLDTIPVLDAFKLDCQCPMCRLGINCEDGYIDSLLSSAYMEPECRVRTNETGFCGHHFKMMYDRRNRLGLALMTHTHLQSLIKSLENDLSQPSKRSFFSSGSSESKPKKIERRIASCDICSQLDSTMHRYAFTAVRLSLDNPEFRALFEQHGVCLPHAALLLEVAEETISGKELAAFESLLHKVLIEDLNRLEGHLEEFTLQFDYRNVGKPVSKEARDSVEHALNRLSGAIVGEEAALPPHND